MRKVILTFVLLIFLYYNDFSEIHKICYAKNLIKSDIQNKNIKDESKKFFAINDYYLYLPNIIDFSILQDAKIWFNPKIIIAVMSSPHNFRKRLSFRELSKHFCTKNTKCKILFFIGYSYYQPQKMIDLEVSVFNDVIQFSFQNSYFNLTILTIMAMKYCFKSFRYIDFYIKTDDDILINYLVLFNTLKYINRKDFVVYGHYSNKFKVNRNRKSKSYIPYFEYPYDICPEYVYGGLIIITYPSLYKIFKTITKQQQYIWKEDVNLGIICKMCNITVKQYPLNTDIKIRSKDCKLNSKLIAIEINNDIDKFYCINNITKVLNLY